MQLFRLTPLDTSSISWQMSRFCGDIIVRAESEADAREEAVSTLLRMPESLPDGVLVFSPWGDRTLVACSPVDSSDELPREGRPGVVWPAGAASAAAAQADSPSAR